MTTLKLALPELTVGQAGKELTHNQALAILDQLVQPVVLDKDLATPPGSPANGAAYLVAAGATGAWAGKSGQIAFWLTSVAAWTFVVPVNGWSVWVDDEAKRYDRKAGAWVEGGGGGTGDVVGPASAVDNQLVLFNGVTGKLVKAGGTVGTAATATVTTSQTDSTASRLTKTGDFGIGGAHVDIAGAIGSVFGGLYNFEGSGTAAVSNGWPSIGGSVETFIWYLLGCRNSPDNRGFQISHESNGGNAGAVTWRGRTFIRGKNSGGSYNAWLELLTARNALVNDAAGGYGYGTGAGGTVTQGTSRTTGVTLNKPCGSITLFSTTTTANQVTTFTLTNSLIAIGDVVNVSVRTATGVYFVNVTATAAGSCNISVFTPAAVGSAEAPILNFAVTKAVTA